MTAPVSTQEAPRTGTPVEAPPEPNGGRILPLPAGDIRSGRPYLLSEGPLRSLARRLASVVALVALDLAGLTLGLYGAFTLRELIRGNSPILWGVLWDAEANFLPFLALVTALVFWQGGLYAAREFRTGFGRIVSSLAVVAALTVAFGLGTGYHFSTFGIFPTALVFTACLVGLLRWSYDSVTGWLLRASGVRRRALLLGEGEHLAHLYRTLGAGRGGIDYDFVGTLSSGPAGVPLERLGGLPALPRVLGELHVDELIVTDSDLSEQELLEVVEEAHRRAVKVRVAPKTTELLVQRGEYVAGQGMPLFELRPPVFAGTDWALKRAFDVAVSVALLAIGLPLWLAIAAAIKLGSRGPVFYRDLRVGLNEREFGMLKFRTMYADAAERQGELEARNEADGPLFKIRRDPRVTAVGRVLRRFSLDEVPNVLNVLRGEMSLVGPRPLPVRDFEQLAAWHRKRYLVLPGMTGLWQISGRSSLSFDDLVRLDFYYLDNWSIWLDITILAKTLPAVAARRGAY
jgi:exopolysaccharide biosynthesis polyprenyl glycosylphosphotransferase